jgi:hypothetical protein
MLMGCGSGKLEYGEVEGKVTLDKKPLAGVKVAFYPDSDGNEQLPYATGLTDASGMYTLALRDGKRGALIGRNRVVVNWPPRDRGSPEPVHATPAIPVRFTVADQSPLVVEVKEGKQTINLELP